MTYLIIKALLSGLIIAIVSEVSRKAPAFGALIVSLPLVSLLAMIWLWNDTQDTARIADHAQATFWYVLPSMPMFLVLPWLLRAGYGFWPSLAGVCLMTIALYALMVWALARFGITL
ncbi:MAG: DUF3147 family protein [Anderseniella sp.]|jgi:hypothetical protein|nr:DUF3147 family protein [Anderseniella sp.]